MRAFRLLMVVVLAWSAASCLEPPAAPAGLTIACRRGADCPEGNACLVEEGRCIAIADACVVITDGVAARLAEGSGCGDGVFCIEGVCQAPRCGDGVVTAGESCDGGAGCRTDCTICGDGVVDDGEGCDNGVANNSDTVPNACRTTCVPARCGDGVKDVGEACDDGVDNTDDDPDGCRTNCARASCGDGIIDDGEDCDDGDANSDTAPDACRTTCVAASCGDGVIDTGDICDDGVANSDVRANACRTACVVARCGDGTIDLDEACDDGDLNSDTEANACRTTCGRARCGDGVIDATEQCDGVLATTSSADACRSDCREMVCGDGVVDAENGELCDDENANPADGCDGCRTQGFVTTPLVDSRVSRGSDVALSFPIALVTEPAGSTIIVENGPNKLRRVLPASLTGSDLQVEDIAGTGAAAFEGDGGPAVAASLNGIVDGAVDSRGNIFVTEAGAAPRVRRIDRDGIITTVAGKDAIGSPASAVADDGEKAIEVALGPVRGIAIDSRGRLFISELTTRVVRRIDPSPNAPPSDPYRGATIHLLVDIGARNQGDAIAVVVDGTDLVISVFNPNQSGVARLLRVNGDGGPVTEVAIVPGIPSATGMTRADNGAIYVANGVNNEILCLADGIFRRVAGIGNAFGKTFGGDGGPALSAQLQQPRDLSITLEGHLIIADTANHRVREVVTNAHTAVGCAIDNGIISTIAGTGVTRETNDGALALSVGLLKPAGLAVRGDTLFVIDNADHRLRSIGADGVIRTVMGDGSVPDFVPQDPQRLFFPRVLTPTATGFAIVGGTANAVFHNRSTAGPQLSSLTLVGDVLQKTDLPPQIRDTEQASGIAVDEADGAIVISFDAASLTAARTLRRRATTGVVTNVSAGATASPAGLAARPGGGVYIADAGQHAIMVLSGSTIQRDVGTGVQGFDGDGFAASLASFNGPRGIAIGVDGTAFIADTGNHRIRAIDAAGIITTIAGNGSVGGGGDGGLASDASVESPAFIAVGDDGAVFVVDEVRRTVRRVDPVTGIMSTVVGISQAGFGTASTSPGPPSTFLLSTRREREAGDGVDRVLLASMIVDAANPETGTVVEVNAAPCDAGAPPTTACDFMQPIIASLPGDDTNLVDARLMPALRAPGGFATDVAAGRLYIAETGGLRAIDVAVAGEPILTAPSTWRGQEITIPPELAGHALRGLAFDGATETLLVVDRTDACVRRLVVTGSSSALADGPTLGRCQAPGSTLGQLEAPTDVVIDRAGRAYVSDTGNNRVLRYEVDGTPSLVIGDGSAASSGVGGNRARTFSVDEPRQLALDRFSNLYIASRGTVRQVFDTNGNGPDGNDGVANIFGDGDRAIFPENHANCIEAIAIVDDDNDVDDGAVFVSDRCFGFIVRVDRAVD